MFWKYLKCTIRIIRKLQGCALNQESSSRGWNIPSLDEVKAAGLRLAASGYTTVKTPSLCESSRQAVLQQRRVRAYTLALCSLDLPFKHNWLPEYMAEWSYEWKIMNQSWRQLMASSRTEMSRAFQQTPENHGQRFWSKTYTSNWRNSFLSPDELPK